MKLYDFQGAPNPRRVKIFAAEKGVELELVPVDLPAMEIKKPPFLQKNPSGKIPVLELDDGTCISESIAICRYLEAMVPEPNLFGESPLETAEIEMRHRHIELELFPYIGWAWVNGPIVAQAGLVEPIAAMEKRGRGLTRQYYERLDGELAGRPYIGGDRFSVADITALCVIDFAAKLVDLKPNDDLSNIWAWHKRVSARPSVAGNPA